MNEQELTEPSRGMQVCSDVARRRPRDWLAIDDMDEGWPAHALPNFVRTHEQNGISDPMVLAEFREKLGRMCK